MSEYKLQAGRIIEKDGEAILSLHRVGSDAAGYTVSPADADILAHRIVNALNHMELLRAEMGKRT